MISVGQNRTTNLLVGTVWPRPSPLLAVLAGSAGKIKTTLDGAPQAKKHITAGILSKMASWVYIKNYGSGIYAILCP